MLILTTSAAADWRDDLGSFRIGIVTGPNSSHTMSNVEPFRLAVQESLGINTEILPVRDLKTLITTHAEGRVEYAIYPASAYATVWQLCECIEPVVVAKKSDQSSTVNSVIIVRKSGSFNQPKDLIGNIIIGLSENSVAGYAFAVSQLAKQGTDLLANGTKFKFFDNGETAIREFSDGQGDAMIGWQNGQDSSQIELSGTLKTLITNQTGSEPAFKTIWSSPPIPNRTHAVKKNLALEAKKLLQNLMIKLFENDPIAYDAIEPTYGGGFARIDHKDYGPLIEFVKSPIPSSPKIDDKSDIAEETNSVTPKQ